MHFIHRYKWLFIAGLVASALTLTAEAQDGPKNATVLIIRHAENPADGHGLSPRGQERAEAYKNYFQNFTVDSKRRKPDAVLVAADSKQSHRPRLTVEPFAKAAKLPIDGSFGNKQPADLAAGLRATHQGKVILICWHHGQIPALLRALGAAPETLLPNGKWPKTVYDWVIMAGFDENGRLIPESTKRISEHLLQGDSQ
jgi:broad specificity phosphatase PhoE